MTHALRVGHFTDGEHATGVSVFLFGEETVGTYLICGSAPATHDINTLDVTGIVPYVNALVFTGGSAYGLSAIEGVMRWHKENEIGFPTAYGPIPIVPGASIFDLHHKKPTPPTAEQAYLACVNATINNTATGRIGAGTGASVGKLVPGSLISSGGIGFATLQLENGVTVSAYALVNSIGDVRDLSGNIIAGAKNNKNEFIDCEKYILAGNREEMIIGTNSTLIAVITDADFSKVELHRIAKMAIAGMARVITPIFSRYDGDILFCFSNGKKTASELTVGTLAAEVVKLAIINAVKDSVTI